MPYMDPTTGLMTETEEEKKRRLEAGTTEVGETTIKTYADGSQTRTVSQEIPGPIAPPVKQPAYNQRIGMMESGGRNIGFHDPSRSTAYGTYGLTNAAYQDARRRNPNLPADIRQATPEQQTAAQNAFTEANAGYLRNYGVPVNENTLAAAHFLGAKGLADFISTGYISPQAAAANGGEANVRRIVQQRLGGQPTPASGAAAPGAGRGTMGMPIARPEEGVAVATGQGVQGTTELTPVSPEELQRRQQFSLAQGQGMPGLQAPTPAQPSSIDYINQYQAAQDDPAALLKLRGDETVPEFIRKRSGERAYELMNTEVQQRKAQEQAQTIAQAAASGDSKAAMTMARTLSGKPTDDMGKWLKATFMTFLQLPGYQEALAEIGVGNKEQVVTDENGKSYLVTTNRLGRPVSGITAEGQSLSEQQLINIAGGASGGKVTTSGTFFQTADGQILRAQSDEKGKPRLVDAASGERYTGSTKGLTKLEEAGNIRRMDRQLVIDLAKKHGQNVLEAEAEYVKLNGPFATPEARQQFRDAYGFGLAQPAPVPGVAGGAPAAAPAAAPSRAQQAAQQLQQNAAPAAAPAVPGAAAPGRVGVPLAQQQAQQAGAAAAEKVVGEDIGKLRTTIGTAERNADYLLTKVDQLLTHPGFSVSVGASAQPGFQFIPGTDKASWYARFNEIKGQQFLQAIEQMRGTGAISEREGQEAKNAISRMSTTQSEAEFKEAAEDFQNIIRRGIDASRKKLGQEPKYGTKPESELAGQAAGTTSSGNRYKRVQ